jgi:protein-tyrosine kinase
MSELRSLVVHNNPKSPIAEAYRVLRTNIQFASVDKQVKVIAVTSASPGEGKTTTIANLAVTFAQTGNKVLLVDGDLRKPTIHKVFGMFNAAGMTTALAHHIDYNTCVSVTDVENLYVLTSGPIPPNPSELLASNAMKNLIEKLRADFDIILIDAPPIGVVTDAAILSTIVDGTILVVSSAHVEIEAGKQAKGLLEKVNANIIGVVLNKITKENHKNYYYNYYYYEEPAITGKGYKRHKNKKKEQMNF